ncbi:hypothetical protein SEA_MADKILLAH_101 [Mycobacterium phage MadKillah]|nr:hypothetical protein SEA_MADKILLAH_101 [Mycobacterium phage MadKillah]
MPEQPIESTEVLASDDVYRAALVALRDDRLVRTLRRIVLRNGVS